MEKRENISEELFTNIEDYLLNRMSAGDRINFEQQMEADNSLKQKVDESRLLIIGVMEKKLEDQLAEFHSELKTNRKSNTFRWYAAAAAVVIITLVTWIFTGHTNSTEKLFAKYYSADPGLITAMSETDQYSFDKAMVDYKTGAYEKAAQQWESLMASAPSDTLFYFTASAYLASGNTAKAVELYQKVANNTNSAFYQDAQWYLGLSLLKENKIKESISWIERSEHADKEELLTSLQKHAQRQ